MIRDLIGAGQVQATADLLVIGGGTAGLVVATELAARGLRVICMESGGREQADDTHPLNKTEQGDTRYAGAEHGRFRCLGGTSTRWGGALIPFQAADMADAKWPIQWSDLEHHAPAVEALFGLPPGSYFDPAVSIGDEYVARLAKWPPFGKRNVYSLLKRQVDANDSLDVWIHATATHFRVHKGKLQAVTAESGEGSSLTVTARETVICAGAIESTRLLLLLQVQNPGVLMGAKLGEGLHDHLSAVIANVDVQDSTALNKLVGFRFAAGGGMRNMRFELAPNASLRKNIAPFFVHIGFAETGGGFLALRDCFRALQRREVPSSSSVLALAANSAWLTKALWWRYFHKRLLFPHDATVQVHLVVEQRSDIRNKITLSRQYSDAFGLPLAKLEWDVRHDDETTMATAIEDFSATWRKSALQKLGSVDLRPLSTITMEMRAGGGIYHPGGTTRLSRSQAEGVVDLNLRVFGVENLALLATSVLPSSGGANPTMTLLLLALRYVESMSRKLD